MDEILEAILLVGCIFAFSLISLAVGSDIGRNQIVQELCSQTQYDFCEITQKYKLKAE